MNFWQRLHALFAGYPQPTPCPECLDERRIATAYFSSDREATYATRQADDIVIGFIERCSVSIDVAVYSITWAPIVAAIIAAHNRGVKVRVLTDKSQAGNQYSDDEEMEAAGIELLRDRRTGSMHNKFMIGDSTAVITGSYNWSDGATNKNVENFVIVRLQHIVNEYKDEFEYLWQHNMP